MTSRRRRRSAGLVILLAGLGLAMLFAFHDVAPGFGGALSMLESVFPWLAIALVALLIGAAYSRTRGAWIGVLAAALVWGITVLPAALPASASTATDFTIVSENVEAGNVDADALVTSLSERGPDVIVLQELSGDIRDSIAATLDDRYPHSYIVGTVGVWSRTALSGGQRLDLGLGWNRALTVDVDTPNGPTTIVAVHIASFRPGEHEDRDRMLGNLATDLAETKAKRLVVIGDFNAATDDHVLAPVMAQARAVQTSGFGFAFTWPSAAPFVTLDHALVRGISDASLRVLDANGSDHRGIALTIGR